MKAQYQQTISQRESAFGQAQIALVEDKLGLTLGSKLEQNDFTGFEYQPTARLLWTPTPRQTLWAAVSRAGRTPNLSEDGIGTRQVPSFPPAFGGAPLFAQLTGSPDFTLELAVVGQNLLDNHHPETGTAQFLRSCPSKSGAGFTER